MINNFDTKRGEAGNYCDYRIFGCNLDVLKLDDEKKYADVITFLANLNNWETKQFLKAFLDE